MLYTAPQAVANIIEDNEKEQSLDADEVHTWTLKPTKGFAKIIGMVRSTQATPINGFEIKQSIDGTNWDHITAYTLAANSTIAFSIEVMGEFVEITITNGTVPATLRCGAYLRPIS